MSAWLARLIRQKTAVVWPEEVRALAGAWADDEFPTAEQLRGPLGSDVPREAF
ncbi:MAG: hypothetical protein AB8H79_07520 [Myxococcota bacterium]